MRQGWRLRTTICAKMFYFAFISSKLCKRQMAFNVPAVYEVGGGIKRLAKQDRRRQFAGMRRGSL